MPRAKRLKKTAEDNDENGGEYFLVQFVDDDLMKICEKKELKVMKGKLHAFWSPRFFPAIVVQKSSERGPLVKAMAERENLQREICGQDDCGQDDETQKTKKVSKKVQQERELEFHLQELTVASSSSVKNIQFQRSKKGIPKPLSQSSSNIMKKKASEVQLKKATEDQRGASNTKKKATTEDKKKKAEDHEKKTEDPKMKKKKELRTEDDSSDESDNEDFGVLMKYYSRAELDKMPNIEKKRYKSMQSQYEKMKDLNLIREIPDFTDLKKRRKRQAGQQSDKSGRDSENSFSSDSEDLPDMKKRMKKKKQARQQEQASDNECSISSDAEGTNDIQEVDEVDEEFENDMDIPYDDNQEAGNNDWKAKFESSQKELSTLQLTIKQLERSRQGERQLPSTSAGGREPGPPRPGPGFLDRAVAGQHMMRELTPGSNIFIYPFMLERIERFKTFSKATRNLLGMFYSAEELIEARKLTVLDDRIVKAIIAYIYKAYKGKDPKATCAQIRQQCHNKVNGTVRYFEKAEEIKAKNKERRNNAKKRICDGKDDS